MQISDILLLIATGIFTAYLALIYILFGWLPSVSQSYYELEKRYGKKYTWLFTVVLVSFAMLVMVAGLEKTSGNPLQFLVFLATAAICFVGVAPQFKESLTHSVHYGGAVVGMLCGALMVLFTLHMVAAFILMLLTVTAIGWLNANNRLYWLELVVFYTSVISLLLFDKF